MTKREKKPKKDDAKTRIDTDITFAKLPLSELNPAAYNPRKISDANLAGLRVSLEKFGLVQPIIVNIRDGRNVIIGGHQRFKLLAAEGISSAMCVTVDRSESDERLLNITLNNPAAQGEFIEDLDAYIDQLRNIVGDDSAILDLRIEELRSELAATNRVGLVDDNLIPEAAETITQLGDLWILGAHRLLCGDSTIIADVTQLMDGKKADMVFTDPPYGVNLKGGKQNKTIASDLTQVAIPFSFDLAVKNATTSRARFYFCGGESNLSLYEKLFDRHLNQLPRHLIWVKNGFVMKPNNYHNQYEMIYFGFKPTGGGLKYWFSGRTEKEASDVWQIKKDAGSKYLHPTQKPVELPERAIKNSSPIGAGVYDPFLGSGSTLIACEKTGRHCFGMELDPHYCDVIVKRWQDWTGKTAERA